MLDKSTISLSDFKCILQFLIVLSHSFYSFITYCWCKIYKVLSNFVFGASWSKSISQKIKCCISLGFLFYHHLCSIRFLFYPDAILVYILQTFFSISSVEFLLLLWFCSVLFHHLHIVPMDCLDNLFPSIYQKHNGEIDLQELD